jgi:hypothetical protein
MIDDNSNQGDVMNEVILELVEVEDEPKLSRGETLELIADFNEIIAEIEAEQNQE